MKEVIGFPFGMLGGATMVRVNPSDPDSVAQVLDMTLQGFIACDTEELVGLRLLALEATYKGALARFEDQVRVTQGVLSSIAFVQKILSTPGVKLKSAKELEGQNLPTPEGMQVLRDVLKKNSAAIRKRIGRSAKESSDRHLSALRSCHGTLQQLYLDVNQGISELVGKKAVKSFALPPPPELPSRTSLEEKSASLIEKMFKAVTVSAKEPWKAPRRQGLNGHTTPPPVEKHG